jgi:hypothetical protein
MQPFLQRLSDEKVPLRLLTLLSDRLASIWRQNDPTRGGLMTSIGSSNSQAAVVQAEAKLAADQAAKAAAAIIKADQLAVTEATKAETQASSGLVDITA